MDFSLMSTVSQATYFPPAFFLSFLESFVPWAEAAVPCSMHVLATCWMQARDWIILSHHVSSRGNCASIIMHLSSIIGSLWPMCFPDPSWRSNDLADAGSKPECFDLGQTCWRKFRSQTSDNMDRWKAEVVRVKEEKKREEERRSKRESLRRKKIQVAKR